MFNFFLVNCLTLSLKLRFSASNFPKNTWRKSEQCAHITYCCSSYLFCLNKADQWWFIWSWIGEKGCITGADLLEYCETLDLLVINLRVVSHWTVITLQMSPDFASLSYRGAEEPSSQLQAQSDLILSECWWPPLLSSRCINQPVELVSSVRDGHWLIFTILLVIRLN